MQNQCDNEGVEPESADEDHGKGSKMADEEQVKLLKQGVEGWNKWRRANPDIKIDLFCADFFMANFKSADFSKANLNQAKLIGANLHGAKLNQADLSLANLLGVNLREANLRGADLTGANLSEADLRRANLRGAWLLGANLSSSGYFRILLEGLSGDDDIGEVDLNVNPGGTNLNRANLSDAKIGDTIFGSTDLSQTIGLEEVHHFNPSTIGTETLQYFKGIIPISFLRGCGLSDFEIESAKLYNPDLSNKEIANITQIIYDLRAHQSIQVLPLFISYNHKDGMFVNVMEKHLDKNGIRFWRDIHDATAGRLEKVLDRAIRQNPIVLLVLSENSVKSDWVEHEARELEKELGRDVLCPVSLDDAWKDCSWPARLREQIMEYNILDFSKWKDAGEFGKMFRKLIDGLDLFYKE